MASVATKTRFKLVDDPTVGGQRLAAQPASTRPAQKLREAPKLDIAELRVSFKPTKGLADEIQTHNDAVDELAEWYAMSLAWMPIVPNEVSHGELLAERANREGSTLTVLQRCMVLGEAAEALCIRLADAITVEHRTAHAKSPDIMAKARKLIVAAGYTENRNELQITAMVNQHPLVVTHGNEQNARIAQSNRVRNRPNELKPIATDFKQRLDRLILAIRNGNA